MAEIDLGDARSAAERRGGDRRKLIVDVRFDGGDGTGIANTRDIGIEDVGNQLEACLSAQVACSASCNAAFAAGDGSVEAAASCRAECGADLAAGAGN